MRALRWLAEGGYFLFTLVLLAWASDNNLAGPAPLGVLALIVLSLLSVTVHETGHAWAAKLCGARVVQFCVAFWCYDFELKRRVRPSFKEREVGGYVAFRFDDDRLETRRKHAFIAAAGPLADIALALTLFALAFALAPSALPIVEPASVIVEGGASDLPAGRLPSQEQVDAALRHYKAQQQREYWAGWMQVLAALSLAGAFFNLLPFRGSDGQRIWRELRD